MSSVIAFKNHQETANKYNKINTSFFEFIVVFVLSSFWDENQPSHGGMESCVHLKGTDSVRRKLLHDADCHSEHYHICERKLEKGMWQGTLLLCQLYQPLLLKSCYGHTPSFFVNCTCLTGANSMYFCSSQAVCFTVFLCKVLLYEHIKLGNIFSKI